MRRVLHTFAILLGMSILAACSSNTWDELPSEISHFVSRYYPGEGVESYGETDNVYHVRIRNGAALAFNKDYSWISVNGYGGTLPQMFLFDQLPPALYERLQDNDATDDVYAVSRDPTAYYVTLLDSTLSYNISSGKISQIR